jgi:hypothetical protein
LLYKNVCLLSQNTERLSQNKLLLIQTPVCFLILVFSASKSSFDFLKPQFAFSFWCFPQVKQALTFSNSNLLSHFGVFRKQKQL